MKEIISDEAEAILSLAVQDGLPAGGAVTGIVVALSAALLSGVADRSREGWPGAAGAVAQAQALQRRARTQAREDVRAYASAREALSSGSGEQPHSDQRDWALGRTVAAAADPPLAVARCAEDVAQLAATVAAHGSLEVRADAVVAAELAAAAAAAAAHLVEVNLVVGSDEERAGRARAHARRAAEAARAAIGG